MLKQLHELMSLIVQMDIKTRTMKALILLIGLSILASYTAGLIQALVMLVMVIK